MRKDGSRARRKKDRAAVACIGLLVAGALLVGAGIWGLGSAPAPEADGEASGGVAGEGPAQAAAQASDGSADNASAAPFSEGTLEEQRNAYVASDGLPESVTTLDEAAAALDAAAANAGVDATFDGGEAQDAQGMRFYRFQQDYQGIPVYGRGATVIVSATGEPVGISSNAASVGTLSTTPALAADDACRVARACVASDAGISTDDVAADDAQLVIYGIERDPALAYVVETDVADGDDTGRASDAMADAQASRQVFVDAQTGEALASVPATLDATTSAEGQLGHVYDNLNLVSQGDTSYLHDPGRNIFVYSLGYAQGIRGIRSQASRIIADTSCDSGVDALGNLAITEDFYDRHLGWEGLDGQGYLHKDLDVYVEVNGSYNAGWSSSDEVMIFMGTDALGVQMSAYFDVVAHEFTHAVTQYTSGLLSSRDQRESYDAINEALSDILSEAAERAMDGRCDWRFGPVGATWGRDFTQSHPLASGADCHVNAVPLDNIAYLIADGQDVDGYTKDQTRFFSSTGAGANHLDQYASFWHRVQMGIPSTCTYQQLATVALGIADAMCTNDEITPAQYRGIVAAFASKGIVDDTSWRDRHKDDPAPEPKGDDTSVTVLAIDTSGSMREMAGSSADVGQTDEQGASKMERAEEATRTLLSVLEAANEASISSSVTGAPNGSHAHSACLVGFSSTAGVVAPVTSEVSDVEPLIGTLSPDGGTNILDALRKGIDACAGYDGDRTIILLTDGEDTEGNADEEIVAAAREAARQGIKVSTIGFGMRYSLDEELLRAIASVGGGTYRYADPGDGLSLAASLLADQADSTGTVLSESRGAFGAGSSGTGGLDDPGKDGDVSFEVGDDTGRLVAAVAWPEAGSDMGSGAEAADEVRPMLEATLVDPQGRVVGEGGPGVSVTTVRESTLLAVENPAPGTWHAVVHAADGASTGGTETPYCLVVSAQAGQAEGLTPTVPRTDVATGPQATLVGLACATGIALALAALCGLRILAPRRRPKEAPRA